LSKPGAENQKSGPAADRGQMRQRAAGGDSVRQAAPRAALEESRKHGYGRVSMAMQARPRPYFGLGVVPLAPFPLVPINTPWGSEDGVIQIVV